MHEIALQKGVIKMLKFRLRLGLLFPNPSQYLTPPILAP